MCAHEIGKHAPPSKVSSLSRCADIMAMITIMLFVSQVQPHCKVTFVGFASTTAVSPNGSNATQSSLRVSF